MTEPNYRERSAIAVARLDDAISHLDEVLIDEGLSHPAKAHLLTAVRHVAEAQSQLRTA
jgi:hypothetical protein